MIDPFFSSSPSAIANQLYEWFSTGTIWVHLLITLREFGIGLLLGNRGSAGRLPLGGCPRRRRSSTFVTVVYSLPKLALAPLFVLWFGIGLRSKVVLVAMISFFLIFYNTFTEPGMSIRCTSTRCASWCQPLHRISGSSSPSAYG